MNEPTVSEVLRAIAALPSREREAATRELHAKQQHEAVRLIHSMTVADRAAAAARLPKHARDMTPDEFRAARAKLSEDAHVAARQAADDRTLAELRRRFPDAKPRS